MTPEWTRRQATLFLLGDGLIDEIRAGFNPRQAEIIDAHITLCREDEVPDWNKLSDKLRKQTRASVTLDFGKPYRDGDLLLLPCIGSTAEFDGLREFLLVPPVRKHTPHVTLIHPRNGSCTDAIFDKVFGLIKPFSHTFDEVSLIGQLNGGKWHILESYALPGS